jgi:hypothetical protein
VRTARRRTLPAPNRLGWSLLVTILLLLAGVGLATTRAQEVDAGERFTPSSRGNRPAVLERAEVVDLAASVFGPELAEYVASISACESSNRPWARSAGWDRLYGWYDHRGLMQVAATIWTPLALELTGSDDLFDPWVNLVTARAIQRAQGWGAWPYCSRRAW